MILAVFACVGTYLAGLYVLWLTVASWASFVMGVSCAVATVAVAAVVIAAFVARRSRLDHAGLPRVTVERLQKRAKAQLAQERRNQKLRVIPGGMS